jgi:S-adenosylmethionine:tRNA ribosyltransferase-isomerase
MLLVEESSTNEWWAMLRPGKRARIGTHIHILKPQSVESGIVATVLATNEEGHRLLRFQGTPNILQDVDKLGEVPLPPYIARAAGQSSELDRERYQTVFAKFTGSVAAPTAGLHFTEALLEKIRARGVLLCEVTLHVGLGTFAPVKCESIEKHTMHEERYEVGEETARMVNEAKMEGRRVIAIGTTSVRVLETIANLHDGKIRAERGSTRIFIYPPFQFRVVTGLMTNFHLPRSTLLMLVSAFAAPGETGGREMMLRAYAEAIRNRYRFFSYGDAMLIA